MNAIIKNLIVKNIRALIKEQLTAENVKWVFLRTIEQLRELASTTDTKIDDWILDTLEPYAVSDQAASSFVAGIHALLSSPGYVFAAPRVPGQKEDALIIELTPCFAAWGVLEQEVV